MNNEMFKVYNNKQLEVLQQINNLDDFKKI